MGTSIGANGGLGASLKNVNASFVHGALIHELSARTQCQPQKEDFFIATPFSVKAEAVVDECLST
jgi:hypothetical protein